MEKFEIEPTPDNKVENVESNFKKRLHCFKNWTQVSVLIGGLFFAGEKIVQNIKEDIDYQKDFMSKLSDGDALLKKEYEKKIEDIFGDSVIDDIKVADSYSFTERKNKNKKVEIRGFSEHKGIGWERTVKYGLTENYGMHPKGWLNDNIGRIEYVNHIKDMKVNGDHALTGGDFGYRLGFSNGSIYFGPTIYLYQTAEISQEDIKKNDGPGIEQATIEHEIGHANDWRNNTKLAYLEREEMLLSVYGRMMSSDAWHHKSGVKYYELFKSGNKEDIYLATTEYWAEICGQFFSNPKEFKIRYPKDFELVNSYVKKCDPSFDILDPNRGAFDNNTGELKAYWINKEKQEAK